MSRSPGGNKPSKDPLMMVLEQREKTIAEKFQEAVGKSERLKEKPEKDICLLRALNNQAAHGDNNTECPPAADIDGRLLWAAWRNLYGMTKDQAMQEFIKKVDNLVQH